MRNALRIALLAGLCSCGLEQVTVTLEGELVLPGNGQGGPVLVPDVPVSGIQGTRFAAARELTSRDIRVKDIDRVQLESLTITPQGGEDLDVIDYVEIFLDSPGLPELAVAEKHLPDGSREIELDVFDDELTAYARASGLSLRAAFQLRRPLREELALRVRARFRVDVASAAF